MWLIGSARPAYTGTSRPVVWWNIKKEKYTEIQKEIRRESERERERERERTLNVMPVDKPVNIQNMEVILRFNLFILCGDLILETVSVSKSCSISPA